MRRLGVVVVLAAFAAWGDVIPDDQAVCDGKKDGDACSARRGEGQCVQTTCSRPDYSKGIPPGRKQVPCTKCLPLEAAKEALAAKRADAGTATAPAPETKPLVESPAPRGAADAGVGATAPKPTKR